MTWYEIVSIRLSKQEDADELLSIFRQIVKTMPASAEYGCYKNATINSDWTFVLRHSDKTMEPGKSRLGSMIIEAIRPFGLVNHTVWVKKCLLGNEVDTG